MSQHNYEYVGVVVRMPSGCSRDWVELDVASVASFTAAGLLLAGGGGSGMTGPMGPSGATGPQGLQGLSGATGPQGLQGLSGATGPQGDAGPSGATGPSGVDPWTIRVLSADTGRANVAFGDISDLSFTPAANTRYMFETYLLLRTGAATNNPRPGIAWPTGMSDGVAMIDHAQTAVARLLGNGNIASPVSTGAAGGIPDTTNSWPALLSGVAIAGASPSGTVRVQYAAELATSRVTVRAGSYLRFRSY
jgi:hypothetical protein